MLKLLTLLETEGMLEKVQSTFNIVEGVLEIDVDRLEHLVSEHEEFRKIFIGVNLNGDHVKEFKNIILRADLCDSTIWFTDVLKNIRMYDLNLSIANTSYTNYFDAIMHQSKINVNVYLYLDPKEDIVYLVDKGESYHGFQISDINVLDATNYTGNLYDIIKMQIKKDTMVEARGDILNVMNNSNTLESPIVYNIVVVKLDQPTDIVLENLDLRPVSMLEFTNNLDELMETEGMMSKKLFSSIHRYIKLNAVKGSAKTFTITTRADEPYYI